MEVLRSSARRSCGRRVVITGIGIVSPLGIGKDKNWGAVLQGKSGVSRISRFDASAFPVQIAGEARDFDPLDFIDRKEARKMDLFIQFAIAAARLAVEDAGIDPALLEGERTGVYVGSGIGGISTIEENHRILLEKGVDRVSPFFLVASIINEAAGQISIKYRSRGPNSATASVLD